MFSGNIVHESFVGEVAYKSNLAHDLRIDLFDSVNIKMDLSDHSA